MALEAPDIEAIKALLVNRPGDSFASFTSDLRKNWMFIMALFAVGFWIVTNVLQINSINLTQDRDIKMNTTDIRDLTNTLDTWQQDQNTSNAEIVRKLDSLQKDIDILSGKP